ncbi:MAG: isoleucine--tRNA ligase [Firmicutes bacterium]|nr:isoleucine--tRNA ligase [Bacillota bacterium]MDY5336024.1 isoleucine--tRNA ligase [Bacilli bacterium]
MNYKETLLMPETSFQMRGNLPENEKLQREKWEEMDLYNKVREKNKGKTPFILHDGPPYANGNIHIGHAMNKILKDFVNRYKMMSGYDMIYIPGWDTHGLPIEQAVTNSGIDRKSMGKADFRALCEKYAYEQIEKQMSGFKELNVLADWAHPYITLQKEMEARQIEVFAEMAKKGLIFKGLKPVYWSPSSESALAEAEIEYHDRKDPSIFVAFPVVEGNDKVKEGDNLVIWTTTPWTLPCNTGIAISDKFDYAKVLVGDKYYIVANELLDSLAKEFNWENYEVVDVFSGSEFKGVKYKHVFMDRIAPVVDGFHVTLDAGTGLVHIAPMYGADDFIIGKEYGLEMVNGIDDQGVLNELSGPFNGLFFEDANKAVTVKLEELGVLLKLKFITHSYPHDWRTKKPIIFRATKQWFCSIDKIRDELLNELENNVKFHTEWGKKRLYNMIHDRGDWCISRQRVWGVPIPIFYNEDGSEIVDYDVMMHVADLFRKYGSNIWFEKEAKDLLPEGYTNPASPNGNFTKEEDIMDVWFDSGSTWNGVLIEQGLPYPSDMYLEGSDQYRGWFNSSLICGVAVTGKAPYKELVSHGFTLDGNGNKMSKSLGNVIVPADMVRLHGSDILRLWVASTDYTEDVRISDDLIKQVKESYRKIRNTYKFMLGNLKDFNYTKDSVKYEDMPYYDKYMMNELNKFTKNVLEEYNNYNFQNVYKLVNNFVSFTLSNFYLDFTKDILYIEKADSLVRRSVQTVLYNILNNEVKLLAPILPYTSEEVYSLLPHTEESVHLTDMPEVVTYSDSTEVEELFNLFFELKDKVNKKLEEARNEKLIGSALEAVVKINLDPKYNEVKEKLGSYLHQLFIVSKVEYTTDGEEVVVEKSTGEKCNRCWNYVDHLNGDICDRCHNIINS